MATGISTTPLSTPDKPTRIYRCPDTIDGILTGIYEAGLSHYGHDYIYLEVQSPDISRTLSLFSEYIDITEDAIKAQKVVDSIRKNISPRAYRHVICALLSDSPEKANTAYHFLVYGFHLGEKITDALTIPWVQEMFAIHRRIQNEAHFYKEFLRFTRTDTCYLGLIEPSCRVVSLITPHFSDRLHCENFMIYDKTHGELSIHQADSAWYIRTVTVEEGQELERCYEKQDAFTSLWQTFFDSIAIEQRINPKGQTNLCPKHFRKHMLEFHGTGQ